ncbi:MAG: DNA repair protein RecO [Bacteroidales bacterium]|nr:DNA repair protein RecO [Bacteroidales bacterium]
MLYKSRAIVLHSIRYGDTSLIVHLITEQFGRQAFIIKGARSKKSAFRPNLFFPLSLLDIEAYFRPNVSLQKIKEANLNPIYETIHTNPIKSAVTFFLAEVLYRLVQTEHFNPELFSFVHNAMILYDKTERDYHNFHLIFLIQLLKYEGISPTQNFSDENKIFSISAARFLPASHVRIDDMDESLSLKFFHLLRSDFSNMGNVQLNSNERTFLINKIIDYLQIHLHEFASIKSLSVLHEVFKY